MTFPGWIGPRLAAIVLCLLGLACASSAPEAASLPPPELQQYRNLGKAFYENPGSQVEAVEQLAKALELNPDGARERLNYGLALLRAGRADEGVVELEKAKQLDPSLPHTYFNLGVEFKNRGDAERAVAEFEKMAELVPDEPKTQYNLGQLYRQQERNEEAIARFERAAELDASFAAPHFQLYNVFRRTDRERAMKTLETFKLLKAAQEGAAVGEDVDWSFYSELYDPPPPSPPVDKAEPRFEARAFPGLLKGAPLGALLLDVEQDRRVDLLVWSAESSALLRNREGEMEATVAEPLPKGFRHAAAGDFDNDGFPDLAIVAADGAYLAVNENGAFTSAPRLLAAGDFEASVWVDFDHDYDLDLLLVGGGQTLLRNNGEGEFSDAGSSFPFEKGKKAWGAAALELEEDGGWDIVIAWEDGLRVYVDRKMGRYEPSRVEGVAGAAGPARFEVIDTDLNGYLDLVVSGLGGGKSTRVDNVNGSLRLGEPYDSAVVFADFANRGQLDPRDTHGLTIAADFDADGLVDLFELDAAGGGRLDHNTTATKNRHAAISLEGVKSGKLAEGARVEVKAGLLYGKQVYLGYPLHFGLAGAESIDTVRVTWPNGLIQNEWRQPLGEPIHVTEKPRLSGSCPMVFTWNGREFEFISEVLSVAPLGASLGNGQYFPVDHDEYLSIGGDQLVAKDGFYEIRITEELREVAYLDQVKLLVVEHPAEVEIFSSEKFKAPPFPAFELYGVKDKIRPAAAFSDNGDVRERLLTSDSRYVDDFERDFRGHAESHTLTLDFPELKGRDDAVLLMRGWVDWADASTIVAASQGRHGFQLPRLEVRDQNGKWVTAVEDVGLPAGRPRTIAVDLRGIFPTPSRELRLVTNLCVYWDEIFASTGAFQPDTAIVERLPQRAELRFRGFSKAFIDPARKQPETYDYFTTQPQSMWNPTPGRYTNYGEVTPLITEIDDRYVIVGAGDEVTLRFAADLPPLPAGRRRDFLLFVDGWAKENEANTAFGDSVEPLPFHEMSAYPYAGEERYPSGQKHQLYLQKYNQRRAVPLIGPLRAR